MADFSRVLLSGSTGGRPIKVAATSSPGTTIHATGISSTTIDEVYVWGYNSDSTDREITIQFGGTSAPDDHLTFTIPSEVGWVLLVPGLSLTGDGSAARTVRAFCAAAANVLTVAGHVNRIS